jgi:hypothetical protein
MLDAIGNFALICSGSNLEILKRDECATDRTKYKMIGIFIFLTAVFAALSSSYALYVGFKSVWLAALVGLLWGIFIFNLDRFIISTIRKKVIDPELSLQEKLYLKSGEIMATLPRLLFAIFVSIVISAPLELKYFDPEIQRQISKTGLEAKIELERKVKGEFSRITDLATENDRLQKQLNDKTHKCEELQDLSFGEAEGRSGTRKIGQGPVYREKRQAYDRCQNELALLEEQNQKLINQNREDLKPLQAQLDARTQELKEKEDESNGFLARLTALHELSSKPGPVGWANLFISMLFILLETTPILMKLISKRGPFDNLLETREYEIHLSQQKAISDMNERVNNQLEFNFRQAELIRVAEHELTEEVLNNLLDLAQNGNGSAQAEVARDIIARWKEKSLRTSSFIRTQPASGD